MGLERLALHAAAIDLPDLYVRCPLFLDQKTLFDKLECWEAAERGLQAILENRDS